MWYASVCVSCKLTAANSYKETQQLYSTNINY